MARTKLVALGLCLKFDKCIMTNFYWHCVSACLYVFASVCVWVRGNGRRKTGRSYLSPGFIYRQTHLHEVNAWRFGKERKPDNTHTSTNTHAHGWQVQMFGSWLFACVFVAMARRQMSDKSVALWNSRNMLPISYNPDLAYRFVHASLPLFPL